MVLLEGPEAEAFLDRILERLAHYLLRPPLTLDRLTLEPGRALYRHKAALPRRGETFDPDELLARRIMHIPAPRLHVARYGESSDVVRARRAAGEDGAEVAPELEALEPGATERRPLRRSWAQLIRRIYEVDPLVCDECGGRMRILALLLDPAVVRTILDHLVKRRGCARAPPAAAGVATAASR